MTKMSSDSVNSAPDFPLIDAAEFTSRRGITPERLSELVAQHRLFCAERDGVVLYPAFFADETVDIRNLEAVCKRLGELPGGSKWQFFVTPKGSLGGMTPIEALLGGRLAAVKIAADGFRER